MFSGLRAIMRRAGLVDKVFVLDDVLGAARVYADYRRKARSAVEAAGDLPN